MNQVKRYDYRLHEARRKRAVKGVGLRMPTIGWVFFTTTTKQKNLFEAAKALARMCMWLDCYRECGEFGLFVIVCIVM